MAQSSTLNSIQHGFRTSHFSARFPNAVHSSPTLGAQRLNHPPVTKKVVCLLTQMLHRQRLRMLPCLTGPTLPLIHQALLMAKVSVLKRPPRLDKRSRKRRMLVRTQRSRKRARERASRTIRRMVVDHHRSLPKVMHRRRMVLIAAWLSLSCDEFLRIDHYPSLVCSGLVFV